MKTNHRELNIAMSAIVQGGEYILEQRTDDNNNGAIGLIGCYGGIIETGGSPHEAIVRELSEEIGLQVSKDKLKQMGQVEVDSDRDGGSVHIRAEVFEISIPYGFEIKAQNSVKMNITNISLRKGELTPATRAAFEKFYLIGG